MEEEGDLEMQVWRQSGSQEQLVGENVLNATKDLFQIHKVPQVFSCF